MSLDSEIKSLAEALRGKLTAIRRDFHQYPEVGFQENRTAAKVAEYLRNLGLDWVQTGVAKTGVVGLLQGGADGKKVVALRVDIDALPMEEANRVPYRSRHPGVMHACGHDAHTTIGLGAAMVLKRLQAKIPGSVKFIFQPAEEVLGAGGAQAMVRAGVLEHPKVDAIFGIHVHPDVPFGEIGLSAGPIFSAADTFHVRIIGKGGHGALPENCIDPLLIAHQIYQAFQGIERNLAGHDVRVISICSMHAGHAFNVIPPTAEFSGTVRTFDPRVRARIMGHMQRAVRGAALTHGAKCTLVYTKGGSAVVNDQALTEIARQAVGALKLPLRASAVSMGSEDFSYYQQKTPGAYLELGIRKSSNQPGFHNNRFDLDEKILPVGVALYARCAIAALCGVATGKAVGVQQENMRRGI